MRAITGLWRWRRNPLRRPTDLLESWLALAAALLIAVGATTAGRLTGQAADEALQAAVRTQHQQRHLVWATVDRLASRAPLDPDPETSSQRDAHRRVIARWTALDHSEHLGQISTLRPVDPGDRLRIWTDGHGRVVPRPMDASTARTHAVLAGLAGAAAVGGLVEGGRRLILRQLMVRRFRRWDRAWERAGQDWGRADAGG
ncbi:Rv1733c family protein [Streptomyces gilvosporeus]|uniref:Uncharacterized protein n=1 Tax=Streptomyces gilvosporeus TaxID=553510 RepID=A0A1V0TN37_9ACTN|nr:hypothetical protein [Streptomyces gilvosporeus]ARF54230.1 hypothetical protein B1H19_08505 [Streptomyces gilvosporeus]